MKKTDRFTEEVKAGRQWLAYPFRYNGKHGEYWRVWRPDRVPHCFGHYKTQDAALRSMTRINRALYGYDPQTEPRPKQEAE